MPKFCVSGLTSRLDGIKLTKMKVEIEPLQQPVAKWLGVSGQ